MADDADKAQRLEQLERDRLITNHQARQSNQRSNGLCRRCGDLIDPRRLAINPAFNHCIDCQTISEQQEVHFARRY